MTNCSTKDYNVESVQFSVANITRCIMCTTLKPKLMYKDWSNACVNIECLLMIINELGVIVLTLCIYVQCIQEGCIL